MSYVLPIEQTHCEHSFAGGPQLRAVAPLFGVVALREELALSHAVIGRDLSSGVYPGLLFALAARCAVGGPVVDGLLALLACGIYFWLFLYSFCLDNQITGVAEDRLNKPDRAIASGRLSLAGAVQRQRVSTALLLLVGACLGAPVQAIVWVALTALNHHAGWDRHWSSKNLGVVGLGALTQLSAAWTIAAPGLPCPWTWIVALAATLGLAMCVQDFRDVAGDRLLRRRTLPIALGDARARGVCVLVLVALPPGLHMALVAPDGLTAIEALFDGTVLAFTLHIARRLWTRRTPRDDDRTYRLLPLLYCAEVVFAAVLASTRS